MKKESIIEDSLEFCKEIKYYEPKEDPLAFDEKNFPNLKEYINWLHSTDSAANQDYSSYEQCLGRAEAIMEEQAAEDYAETEIPGGMLDEAEQPKRYSYRHVVLQIAVCIAIAFALVFVVNNYVTAYTTVNGESMENTLYSGDVLMINRISYRFHEPEQFDVIVFQNAPGVNLVKRIIGMPGQTIQIVDGTIYIDGEVLNEGYGKTEISTAGIAATPITLGEDEYFVLGDNRNNSTDSRSDYVGLVKREDIVGKVLIRLFPFDRLGMIE